MDSTNETPDNPPATASEHPTTQKRACSGIERRPEEIQDEATFRAASIFKSWQRLQLILESHQETILKRWARKTRAMREDILLDAWPDIPRTHRPDFALFHRFQPLKELITDPDELIKSKWPNLNLEDLSISKNLPMLMDSRARYSPSDFARSDLDSSVISRAKNAFPVTTCPDHSMSLRGDTPGTYGQVVFLVGDAHARDRLQYGVDYTISQGLLVLEIQQKLLQFLESCCEGILHDKPPPISQESWTTLNERNKTSPYRVPKTFDFQRLVSLLAANLTMNADHLWDLRNNPEYFLETVQAYESSRREAVHDQQGHADPATKTQDYWEICAGTIAEKAYSHVIMAEIIYAMAAKLRGMHDNLPKIGPVPSDSPECYGFLEGMLQLMDTLWIQYEETLFDMSSCIPTEKTFRDHFIRESSDPTVPLRCTLPRGQGSDPLFPFIYALIANNDELESQVGRTNLMVEIERLLEGDPKEKKMLSPHVLLLFGMAGIFMSTLEEVDLVHPSLRPTYRDLLASTREDRVGLLRELSKVTIPHAQFLEDLEGMPYDGFGPPNSGNFEYPCWKPRSQQNIDQMRQAEQYLDSWWEKFDHGFHESCGKSLHDYDPHIFKCRQIIRTPGARPKPKHQPKDSGIELDEIDTALAELDKGSSSKIHDGAEKTSSPDTYVQADGVIPAQAFLAINREHFTFTERSLKVFRKMFATPIYDFPSSIKWNDFLNAMVDAGFQITKQYGSLWLFTPVALGVDRSIFLCEPPPEFTSRSGLLELRFKHSQRLARRLSYAYGWDETWFPQE